jgi:hypothetical protein
MHYDTPREHLFSLLGLPKEPKDEVNLVGKGRVIFIRKSPTELSRSADGANFLAGVVKDGAPNLHWKESSSFVLRRGPYVVAAGMDESDAPSQTLTGNFIDLFDPKLGFLNRLEISPSSRHLLVDLNRFNRTVIASAGQVAQIQSDGHAWKGTIEGLADVPAVLLLKAPTKPRSASIDCAPIADEEYDQAHHLLWLRFPSKAKPQSVEVAY